MISKAFNWLMIGIIVLLSLWLLTVYGEIFRAHLSVFVFLWFFIPIAAFWLGSKAIRRNFTLRQLTVTRIALVTLMVLISFACFAHYDQIRDAVGYQLIGGYHVSYYEDTDDSGRPYRASSVSTDHWYSRVALWVCEIGFLILLPGLPYLTWSGSTRAMKHLELDSSPDESSSFTSEGVYEPTEVGPSDRCLTCFTPFNDMFAFCSMCGKHGMVFNVPYSAKGERCFYHQANDAFAYCCLCSHPICQDCNNKDKQHFSFPAGFRDLYYCKSCTSRVSQLEAEFRSFLESTKCCAKHHDRHLVFSCKQCSLPLCELCSYFKRSGWLRKQAGDGPYCLACYRMATVSGKRERWLSGLDTMRLARKTTKAKNWGEG